MTDYTPYKIHLETAPSWMDRPLKVVFTTETPNGSTSQAVYLDEAERTALIAALGGVLAQQDRRPTRINPEAPIPYVGTTDDFVVNTRAQGEASDAQLLAQGFTNGVDFIDSHPGPWGAGMVAGRAEAARLRAAAETGGEPDGS